MYLSGIKTTYHSRKHTHCHPRNPLSRIHSICHSRSPLSGIKSIRHPQKLLNCHPQLDWGSRLFLFFFNTKRKGIYFGFHIKCGITKNTSWIPAIASNDNTIVIPNLIGDPESFSFYLMNKYILDFASSAE